MHAGLKKFLKKHAVDEELAVLDKKLGSIVQEKLGINCVYRCGRRHAGQLVPCRFPTGN